MSDTMIATQRYACGPYAFTSRLPRVGTAGDVPQWSVDVDGEPVPGVYGSPEEAMRAALDWRARP